MKKQIVSGVALGVLSEGIGTVIHNSFRDLPVGQAMLVACPNAIAFSLALPLALKLAEKYSFSPILGYVGAGIVASAVASPVTAAMLHRVESQNTEKTNTALPSPFYETVDQVVARVPNSISFTKAAKLAV